jgi:hypothetical protein
MGIISHLREMVMVRQTTSKIPSFLKLPPLDDTHTLAIVEGYAAGK